MCDCLQLIEIVHDGNIDANRPDWTVDGEDVEGVEGVLNLFFSVLTEFLADVDC